MITNNNVFYLRSISLQYFMQIANSHSANLGRTNIINKGVIKLLIGETHLLS